MRYRHFAEGLGNLFLTLYRDLGFKGASSHSGRRTFALITLRKGDLAIWRSGISKVRALWHIRRAHPAENKS
jgi:hypothetical protein